MRRHILVVLFSVLAALPAGTAAAPPGAGDSKTPSRIIAATVYTDRAMVTREGKATLVPGVQEVIVSHLPAQMQDESVRVSATGIENAKIMEVKVHRMFLDTVSTARIKPLLDRSKALVKHIRELNDRAAVITQQKDFISKIGFASQESIARELKTQRPSVDDYRKLLGFFDSELTRLDEESRAVNDQTTETQQSLQTVQREIREIGGSPEKSEKEITITFDVPRAGPLTLECTYIVPQAGWTPKYDVRAGSSDSIVSLTYAAYVRQNTGEDWKNAKITLSTSHPSLGGAPPELLPWLIGPAERAVGRLEGFVKDAESGEPLPGAQVSLMGRGGNAASDINGFFSFDNLPPGNQEVRATFAGYTSVRAMAIVRPFTATRLDFLLPASSVETGEISLDGSGLQSEEVTTVGERPMVSKNATSAVRILNGVSGPAPAAPPPPPPALFQTATVSSAVTAASFEIPGESSIPSDNANHRVTVMVAPLTATFSHTAAPKLQTDVFFKAAMRNTTDYPLLAGPMSAFVDNSFVSTSRLHAVMPGEPFDAFLGVDNGIHVERKLLSRVVDVSGLFSKTRKTRYEILITAENRKKQAETLSLRESIPVSQDEQVKVQIDLPHPEEAKPDAGGILTWQVRLAPGEKREFRVQYSIEAPTDMNVGGLE